MALLHILRAVLLSTLLFASVNGLCLVPRERKEWRSITSLERALWIKAVKCLAKKPHNPNVTATIDPTISLVPPVNSTSSNFDDFVYAHMDLNFYIHGTGYFLPWHRLYVKAFEDALRCECGYTGVQPYWDWTQDTSDFFHSTFFSDSTFDGLGSWGDSTNDYQISTGGLKDITVSYPVPHHIRRNFTIQPFLLGISPPGAPAVDPQLMINTTFTKEVVDFQVNSFTGDYVGFQANMEGINGPHVGPHVILGGDMSGLCPFGLTPPACYAGAKWTPSDPLFYFHHAMIDKIWYDWQRRDPSNKNAFGGGTISAQLDPSQAAQYPTGAPPLLNLDSVIPGDGLWYNVTVRDVIDTKSDKLCYVYA